ncbi:MAG: ATP-binding protein, partial [Elusimicrobiota bacterium]
KVVREVAGALRADRGMTAGVKIAETYDQGIPPLLFDQDMVRQVIWNIVINSIEAMDGKGRLSLKTLARDGRALLRVEDTGSGVDLGIIEKIFQPFYTTKKQGTGLGLAIAQRIINQHAGAITVENLARGGACFIIDLPIDRGSHD